METVINGLYTDTDVNGPTSVKMIMGKSPGTETHVKPHLDTSAH